MPNALMHPVSTFRLLSPSSNGTATYTPQKPVEVAFAQELIAYWLSFVRSGNPNTFKLPQSPKWDAYTATNKARIVLQQGPADNIKISGSFPEIEDEKETKRCEVVARKAEGSRIDLESPEERDIRQ